MFFYTSLFIVSLITALIFLYLYNTVAGVGKAFYQAPLPSAKSNRTNRSGKTRRFRSTVNDAPTPWGWMGNESEIREQGPKSVKQEAAAGFDSYLNKNIRSHGARKTSPKKANLNSKRKPWGW